ncbi:MAG: GDSL-type esterase/lipase family protein [Blastocatellia bacterium]
MMMKKLLLALLLGLFFLPYHGAAQQSAPQKIRFANEIEAFLKADQVKPPPQNAILFVGSSIFRRWEKLTAQMAPLPVFNRAFGGSRSEEVLYYMDKIVLPYKPKIIAYYCGSNDINAKITPQQIADNFKQFVARVHKELPNTKIFFVSINRAPEKMDKWAQVDEANKLVQAFCATNNRLGYIDVNPALFDKEGKPRMELYLPDNLHFQEPAYVEFTAIIKPILTKAWQQK